PLSSTPFPYTTLFRSYAHLNQPNLELINVPILKIEEKKLSLKIPDNLGLNGYPVQLYISNDQTSQAYGDELGLIIVNILGRIDLDRKSTRLNSSHVKI